MLTVNSQLSVSKFSIISGNASISIDNAHAVKYIATLSDVIPNTIAYIATLGSYFKFLTLREERHVIFSVAIVEKFHLVYAQLHNSYKSTQVMVVVVKKISVCETSYIICNSFTHL